VANYVAQREGGELVWILAVGDWVKPVVGKDCADVRITLDAIETMHGPVAGVGKARTR
jgi:hypothetical protein